MKNDYTTADEIVTRRAELLGRELPPEERQSTRSRVKELLSKMKPGNWAWRKLEDDYALDGDYTPDEPPERELSLN